MTVQSHWDEAYHGKAVDQRSWSSDAATSLRIIGQCQPRRSASIVDVGGGASPLAGQLVKQGYENVTVLDVSQKALDEAYRVCDVGDRVRWICADIRTWQPDFRFDVWHDRAVLHFLIDAADRTRYLNTVHRLLNSRGLVVLAGFAEDGPGQCSGLPVRRASHEDLIQMFGGEFKVVERFREIHLTPWTSEQPFNWLVMQRR
ncbi:MAG: class I SAM-dependent methyltransferase [Actinobacteria bacterium]|nr:class I SAM-dependent methyltransferase [Actinomycetota bacterium]NCV96664.1 class I SAM-dependent methyltransferase [Acidimicrobiia bacterium]NCX31320.1 class I SAM-dependent methyltransferase [Actinomycetota bacterium]